MADPLPFEVEKFEIVDQVPNLRVVIFTLAPGQFVPWHIHTEITDKFFCLQGRMVVSHKGDLKSAEFGVGESYTVPPGTPHQVSGKDGQRCRFAIVQGIGTYDFVPVTED